MFQRLFLFLFILLSFSACSDEENNVSEYIGNEYTGNTQIEINFKYEDMLYSSETAIEFLSLEEINYAVDEIKTIRICGVILNDSSMLSQYQNLESIFIENCNINDFSFLSSLQNLKSLYLSNCIAQEYQSIKKLPNKQNLTELNINYCQQGDVALKDISFLKNFYHIEKLGLIGNDISDISVLSEMKELQELFLTDGNFSLNTLEALYSLKNLKLIQISMAVAENLSEKDITVFGNPFFPDKNTIIEID